jgi:hypothetical protein
MIQNKTQVETTTIYHYNSTTITFHLSSFSMVSAEDDFEIKSKIFSLNLRLVLNHILNTQDVLSFQNLFFTLFF